MAFARRLVWLVGVATTALVALYTLAMLGLTLGWWVAPERYWQLALANIFAPFFFVPLILVVPLALLWHSRLLWVMTGLLLLLFVAQFAGRLVPTTLFASTSAHHRLRVVTFNHLFNNKELDATLEVLKAQQADIVALQELSPAMVDAIGNDDELATRFPYRALYPDNATAGLGVLSRYQFRGDELTSGIRAQQLTLDVGGRSIKLINVHPPVPAVMHKPVGYLPIIRDLPLLRQLPLIYNYDPNERNQQLQELLALIDLSEGPLLVLGDFNTADRDTMYSALAARLWDAYDETGWGFGLTFPNNRHEVNNVTVPIPLLRLDYIWSGRGLVPLNAQVVCEAGGSDHCMVVADLAMEH